MGHKGDWRDGGSQWEAEEMNQPLLAFETSAHPGALGKAFSVAHVSSPDVEIGALKVAENGNDLIVRLNELNASSERVKVGFATKVVGAKEVDGQERPIGPAAVEGGDLVVDMTPYHPRAFQLHLSESDHRLAAPKSTPVALPFDTDVTTPGPHVADGAFDNQQRSMPGDLLRSEIVSGGVRFKLGSSSGGKNALVCNGQTIDLPEGKSRRLYLLAASDDGDTVADFKTDGVSVPIRIQAWDGYVGQWDNRLWGGEVPKLAYDWHNPIVGLEPGFIKRDPVAWYADHRRLADGSDDPYAFCYLFRYSINIPDGVTTVTLPSNEKVRIMAASIGSQDFIRPIQPLYDVLERTNMPGPSITPEGGEYHDSLKVSLDHSFYWTPADQLRYTLDGSDPGPTSPIYQGPVWVRQDAVLKVADVDSHGKTGVVSTAQFKVNDTTPASIVSASAMAGSKIVKLVLSEPVVSGDAANPGNYSIDPSRPVQSAEISADGMGVTLHLGEPVTPGTTYTLNVQGLRDFSPNANATHAMAQIQPATPALTADGKPGSVRAPQLPTKAGAKWTINFFTYMTQQPGDLSLLAGFGSGGDENGAERYIIQHNGHIYFWGSNIDIESDQAYDLNRWQMITATYDGQTLRLYKDGKEIVHDGAAFADARPVARIAPPAPWEYGHRFDGKIAGLTIWSEALSREELQELLKATPK
jgi:alpha-mannosidase